MEQLTVDVIREDFLEAVQVCAQVVKKSDPIPAYQCLRMEVRDGNQLQIAGLSREITVITTISARVVHAGEPVAVYAERLAAQLDAMPENETVRLVTSGRDLALTAPKHRVKVKTLDWQLLPVVDIPNQTTLGTLTDGAEGIFRGFYAADDDGILASMRLDVKDGNLIVSGTNRYRGAQMAAALGQNHNEQVFSLPKDTASLVARLFKGKTVTVTCNDRYVAFQAGTMAMVCLTMALTPPDIGRIIPAEYTTRLTIPVKAFRKEVKACRATADKTSFGKISIEPETGTIHISSTQADYGETSIEVAGLNGQGQTQQIGINLTYLDDALGQVSSDAAILAIPDQGRMLAILPQFGQGETHIIMPMALR